MNNSEKRVICFEIRRAYINNRPDWTNDYKRTRIAAYIVELKRLSKNDISFEYRQLMRSGLYADARESLGLVV